MTGKKKHDQEKSRTGRVAEPPAPAYPASLSGIPDTQPPDNVADRSKWPPKLKRLVEESFPEEGKEERIKRARELVLIPQGEDLCFEEFRYYAEDADLEYDL
ncbi:MAG: hypothetical protein N3D11_03110 [Candidatus Sumerlaeia bacterium]|nr:hypothetical protein [Candidatus Sumerlaeia bacterium]